MFNLTEMKAIAAPGMSLAGGAISAYGNIMQGFSQNKAAEMNAEIEEDNADFAMEAGEDRAKTILKIGEMTRASIRNRASASGLVADTGSPLLIQEEALYESSMDALKAKYAGRVQAYGNRQRASLYRFSGRQAISAGFMNAAGSMLDSAGTSYRMMSPEQKNSLEKALDGAGKSVGKLFSFGK